MKRTYNTIKNFRLFSSAAINRAFRIKLYGVVNGVKRNTLLGFAGAFSLLGERLYKFVERALAKGEDKLVFSINGMYKITLYSK